MRAALQKRRPIASTVGTGARVDAGTGVGSIPARIGDLLAAGVAVGRTGVVRPVRPDRLLGMGLAALRNGPTVATALAAGAARHPNRIAVIDERGPMSYQAASDAAQALAAGLASAGVSAGDKVGVLLRNSRYMVLTLAALAHLGADALLLNTGFAAPQATEVMKRHEASAVIHDDEFVEIIDEAARGRVRVVGWTDDEVGGEVASGDSADATTIDALLQRFVGARIRRPRWTGRLIILTSGTTGTPKGASRGGMHMAAGVEPVHGAAGEGRRHHGRRLPDLPLLGAGQPGDRARAGQHHACCAGGSTRRRPSPTSRPTARPSSPSCR